MVEEVKLGLVGVGPWARRYVETAKHLKRPAVRFVSYLRQKDEDVDWLPGARRVVHWQDMFLGEVDGVVIACGPSQAIALARGLTSRGIPVLIEKPVTTTGFSMDALMRMANASGGWARVGYVHLHSSAYQRFVSEMMLRLRANDDEIVKIRSLGLGLGPVRSYSPLWDYGSHDASMILDILYRTQGYAGFLDSDIKSVVKNVAGNGGERWHVQADAGDDIKIEMVVGNDGTMKTRMLIVETKAGELYIYDDSRESDKKVCMNGTYCPVDGEGALTYMLAKFVREIGQRQRPIDRAVEVELAAKVTSFLHAIEMNVSAQGA